jgi:dihydrofolate synthase / folylpolyglutamate synthase
MRPLHRSRVDPLTFLFGLERLGMKFGLENMTALCAALGNPERSFQSVIVAGTNGKGSVTAMAAAALHAAGHRSARYTSPHLERIEERFVIGDREVPTTDLVSAAGTVQATVDRLLEQGTLKAPPTFFECATAIAFELFRRANVTIAVLEVGLGGRLDATNVVTPIAAAITSIDFDHQAQLGNTLESIAREKAGVIKPGIPVVCGPLPSEAEQVIAEVCAERRARFIRALDRVEVSATIAEGRTVANFRTLSRQLSAIEIALSGRHQTDNAAVAISLLDELSSTGVNVSDSAIRAALAEPGWPARLERRRWQQADLLIDAAHNPAGTRSLAEYLREIGWTEVTLVFGVMRDKDVASMLPSLFPLCASIVCTTPATPRAMPADALASLARALPGAPADIRTIDDPEVAVRFASQPGSRVVIAGSIFLVGPVRGILR